MNFTVLPSYGNWKSLGHLSGSRKHDWHGECVCGDGKSITISCYAGPQLYWLPLVILHPKQHSLKLPGTLRRKKRLHFRYYVVIFDFSTLGDACIPIKQSNVISNNTLLY